MAKGQAALEFLTTYGWAFLIILVMVGAMYYFGWIDVDDILPQKCQFGAEMHCDRWALASDGTANFRLKNSLPGRVYVSNMEWTTPEDDEWSPCVDESSLDDNELGQVFESDSTADFSCVDEDNLGTYLVSDEKQRVKIRLTYNEGTSLDEDYIKYLYGDIHANVR